MKKFFKLIPAALALVALASCSNDELFTEKQQTVAGPGELIVECDPIEFGEAATRGFRQAGYSAMYYVESDKINVYDADLYKHDRYKFEGGKFVIDGKKYGIVPKYALFPSESVVRGYWDHETDLVNAEFAIPEIIKYDANSEMTVEGTKYYAANLPMFGYAAADGEGVKITNMRHLVAILEIDLKNALYNANWLRLRNGKNKPLSGTFVATLNPDPAKRDKVKLKKGADDLIVSDAIYLDLRSVPSDVSTIFVPVIPGLDGATDNITLMYSNDTADDPTTIGMWLDTGCKFPKTTFEQHKLYTATHNFAVGASTPNEVSALLAQYAPTAASDIVVNLEGDITTKNFYTEASKAGAGTVFAIPATPKGVNIVINLTDKLAAWNGADDISFEDADAEKPFTGKITFNVGTYLTAAQVTALTVNLPKADVVLAGDFTGQTGKLNLTAAKSVTIGDGATETKLGAANLDLQTVPTKVQNLTIAPKATVTDDIRMKNVAANLTVSGQVVGTINLMSDNNAKSKLTLNSSLANPTDIVVTGGIWTQGDVEIALPKEAVAAASFISMFGAKSTITVTGGLVKALYNYVNNSGSWEDNDINLVLGGNVPSEILSIEEANGPFNISGTTTWNAGKIQNGTYADKKTNYKKKDGTDANAVLTAYQLATLSANKGDINIYANINLNSKDWTSLPITSAGTINGQGKTISNLKKSPLLDDFSYDLKVQNLTLNGVELDGGYYKGALAGQVSSANLDIAKVTVTGLKINLNMSGGKPAQAWNNGGLFGYVYASSGKNVKFSNVKVGGTIDCAYGVGGIVGTVNGSANFTFDNCTSTVSISQTFDAGKAMQMDYARIGGFVGTAYSYPVIEIKGGSATAPTHAWASKEFHSDTSTGSGDFYMYTPKQNFIGFSGARSGSSSAQITTAVKISGTEYKIPVFKTENGNPDGPGTCNPLYHFATQKSL